MQVIKSEVKLEGGEKPQRPIFAPTFASTQQRLQIHHQVGVLFFIFL